MCESFHGAICALSLKISVAEEFLSSEFLLQGLRYIFNSFFALCPQNKSILLAELYPRGVKEKQYYSFLESWLQIYRGEKTLKFWLPNLKPPEWSRLRALNLSCLEFSCRTLLVVPCWNTSSLITQLGISWFLCVLGINLSLAIQKALLELTYTVKDRLQKQIPGRNISFSIFLLPYSMQLYYASSDFFRNLAGIQDIEKLEKKASLGLNHGSALYKQGTLGRFVFFGSCFVFLTLFKR